MLSEMGESPLADLSLNRFCLYDEILQVEKECICYNLKGDNKTGVFVS